MYREIPLLIDEPRGGTAAGTIALAHGAGAGKDSPFMEQTARALAAQGLRVARFDFPYMQAMRTGGKRGRPDSPSVLEEAWLSVVEQLGSPAGLVIGGKSLGGRIASMIADRAGVKGLVCLGYPFHPAGQPLSLRVTHMKELKTPTLILQGERDTLGSREEIAGYTLSRAIRIVYLGDGDHSFKPRKISGYTFEQNFMVAVAEIVAFCAPP
ncbi:MAG: alpha/beta family hydrolase, partial [Spirochaetia bacterium]